MSLDIISFSLCMAKKHGICVAVYERFFYYSGVAYKSCKRPSTIESIKKQDLYFYFSDDEILEAAYWYLKNDKIKREWFDSSVFNEDNDLIYL